MSCQDVPRQGLFGPHSCYYTFAQEGGAYGAALVDDAPESL